MPAIKVIRTYEGKRVGEADGKSVYDLGQNISGLLQCKVKGKAGSHVSFYPAEKLTPEGAVDQMAKNWMPIDTVITYILAKDDAEETFAQTFTYFAGRYLAVAGEAEMLSISAQAISSA